MEHLYPLSVGSAVSVKPKPSPDYDVDESRRVPCARSGHCAVADENNVYLFGGYNPDDETIQRYFGSDEHTPLFGEVWRYHIPSNTWHLMSDDGDDHFRLASMSAIRRGTTVLIYGGTSYPFGYQSSNSITWLDLRHNEWHHKKCTGEKKPIRSYGQAIAVIGSFLYVYGGTTGWVYCSDLHRCNLQTGQWERLFDLNEYATRVMMHPTTNNPGVPEARYRHEMLSDGRELYIMGGGTSQMAFTLDKVNAFNIDTKSWELLETIPDERHGFPGRRRCHGCCQLDKVGYITGGFDGQTIYDDVWLIDLSTMRWTKLDVRLPRPIYFHSSAMTPSGCLYIHGGVLDQSGTQRTDALIRIWVRLPPLLRLAWHRVVSLLKNPSSIRKEKLQAMGVPPSLLPEIG